MSYATRADLGLDDALLTWLTRGEAVGMADDGAIEDALIRASALIDMHLSQRYTVPYEDTDGLLRDYCTALARLTLYRLRPDGPEVPAIITDAAADARRDLREIAAGRLSLYSDTAPAETGKVYVLSADRMLSRDTMALW